MDLLIYLQPVSILMEVFICGTGMGIAVLKKKTYGYFIALTFGIYVGYDLVAFTDTPVSPTLLSIIFLLATISMLYVVWTHYVAE
jgi:hypothetical protein